MPELVNILLTEQTSVCTKAPVGVRENATYIVDTSKLKSPDGIRADDLGVWVNNGVRRVWLTCKVSGQIVSNVTVVGRKKPSGTTTAHYQLVRSYFYHKHSKDFRRSIFQLFGKCVLFTN